MTEAIANLVSIANGKPMTTSNKVAEVFGKNHKDVLRIINGLEIPEETHRRNFAPVEVKDKKGELRKAYTITRDGFTLLAMGFTGAKAMKFKLAYIEAFNAMEEQVKASQSSTQILATEIVRLLRSQAAEISRLSILDAFAPDFNKFGTASENNGQARLFVRRGSLVAQKTAVPFASLRAQPMLPGMSDEDCIAQLAQSVPAGHELVIRPQE